MSADWESFVAGYVDNTVNDAALHQTKSFMDIRTQTIFKILHCKIISTVYGNKAVLTIIEWSGEGGIGEPEQRFAFPRLQKEFVDEQGHLLDETEWPKYIGFKQTHPQYIYVTKQALKPAVAKEAKEQQPLKRAPKGDVQIISHSDTDIIDSDDDDKEVRKINTASCVTPKPAKQRKLTAVKRIIKNRKEPASNDDSE